MTVESAKALNWLKKRRIGVLYGGLSEEKQISRRTGRAILKAFQRLGLKAAGIEADSNVAFRIRNKKVNFCFIALHGKWGEDGTVQGLCELMGIPYSGSGVLASAVGMNKIFSKQIFVNHKIPTAPFEIVSSPSQTPKLKLPFVIKPCDSGSAIGVSIVKNRAQLRRAMRAAFRYSDSCLVEKYIRGKEITAPVLGERVLPLIEIVPKNAFYDYKAKYVKGMSDHILPARISKKSETKIKELALKVHRALGCRAFSRVDFILDTEEKPWVLELNSIPGMTETSLFPEAARAAGFTFEEMILEMTWHSLRH